MVARLLTIGEFSAACRLSPKALRLYDRLGLLRPAQVDAVTGYRGYAPTQIVRARTVGLLRRMDMPLALIADVLDQTPQRAVASVVSYADADARAAGERAELARYVCLLIDDHQQRDPMTTQTYRVRQRSVPKRAVLSAIRRAHADELGAVLGALLGAMSSPGPGVDGVDGCPYLVHYAEVSQDSDGPVEVVRPMADLAVAQAGAAKLEDVQARVEPAHEEAFVALTMAQTRGNATMEALDALLRFVVAQGGIVASPPRQVMIADWRTAEPDELTCHLAVTVRAV
ncbi:MAG: MerR family transcriptional regulator [Terracoccus sp.]